MPTKYLSHFPKPLLDDLVTGRWLPVVGAGMSVNATAPAGKKMPLWSDLAKTLAEEQTDFAPNGTLDTISAYQHEFGRARLIERLSEILLVKDAQPGEAHKEFCSIPFDIVCTTNFDFLLERQYDITPRYVYPVVDEEQLSINSTGPGTLLLKLHGDLRHPSRLVVTEADYDGFIASYPLLATYLSNQLITKTAVFVGYSLDDPDFRQLWHVVSSRLGRTRRLAYAIMSNARPSDIARFERRGVKVINLPRTRESYGDVLAATFRELREYLRENVISVSKVTEEKPLQELLLPRDSTTRLCFFAVPLDLLPFYKERVFPLAEEAGFVPVSADDVISPGDNVSAKVDALVDRASVMVVEVGSQWTHAEFRIGLARIRSSGSDTSHRQPLRLIVVKGPDRQSPPTLATNVLQVERPDLVRGDAEPFLTALKSMLLNLAEQFGIGRQAEPRRLLAAKEYRAAVISAMTLLESTLRDRMNKRQWADVQRPMSLRGLVERAASENIISPDGRPRIEAWMRVRNEVVHSPTQIDKAKATEIVNGVFEVLGIV